MGEAAAFNIGGGRRDGWDDCSNATPNIIQNTEINIFEDEPNDNSFDF